MLKSEIFRKTPLQSSIESHKQRFEEAASIKSRINHKDLDLRSVIRDYETQHKLPRLLSPTLPPTLLNSIPPELDSKRKFVVTLKIDPGRWKKAPKKETLPRNGLGIRRAHHLGLGDRREVSEPPLVKSSLLKNPPTHKRSRTLTPDVVEVKAPDKQVTSGRTSGSATSAMEASRKETPGKETPAKETPGKEPGKETKRWLQIVNQAKDSKHKSDQMRKQQKSVHTILLAIDSILLFIMGFGQNDGPSLLTDWNNLILYIKHTISLARIIHEKTKKAIVETLAGLLFFLKGSVERHVMEMMLRSPDSDIKRISELYESVKKSFTEGEYLMGFEAVRNKFPQTFSHRKLLPIRGASSDYKNFYLPLGCHSDLNQAVGLGRAILQETNDRDKCGLVLGVVKW